MKVTTFSGRNGSWTLAFMMMVNFKHIVISSIAIMFPYIKAIDARPSRTQSVKEKPSNSIRVLEHYILWNTQCVMRTSSGCALKLI